MSLSWDRERLHAHVTFTPTASQPVGPRLFKEIIRVLEMAGLQNVDKKAVSDALADVKPGKPVLVATGKPPIPGRDGYVDYKVKVDMDRGELAEDDSGRVDYRELDLFANVRAGDVVAVLMEPGKGRPGLDVFGQPIPPKGGKPARIRVGRTVTLVAEGKKAQAACDGMPCLVRDRLEVLPVYKIRGDVNYVTGNVRFVGDVYVTGSVIEEFLVEADDNVFIEHSIEKACVTAGKDIEVGWGIAGKEDAVVRAGGNLKAGFADNTNLEAGGQISIGGEVLWCNCEADFIEVAGANSSVKGGRYVAYTGMKLSQVGDPRSTVKTELVIQPKQKAIERLHALIKELEQVRSRANDKLSRMRGSRNVTEKWREKAEKDIAQWQAREKELKDELAGIQAKVDHAKEGTIVVVGDVYPGTKVVIWNAVYKVRDALHAATFKYKDDNIVVTCTDGG